MGYEILKVCFHQQNSQEMIGDVQILENGAENQYLKMFIQKDGTISVENKKTKEVYHHLNAFVEKGDDGDEYNY